MGTDYKIITDSGCDLPDSMLGQEGILSLQLGFSFGEEHYLNGEMSIKEFYNRLRAGEMPRTSQVNVGEFSTQFRSVLESGRDILYIAFSSGLTGTINSARIAAKEMLAEFPERKIEIVDSLSGSLGQGLLVHLANERKKAGATLREVSDWAAENSKKIVHYITLPNLDFLHHGGRISKAVTVIGTLLGIQPILKVDEEGKPQMIGKKRGKQAALDSIVEHIRQAAENAAERLCFIAHADNEEDAFYLRDQIKQVVGVQDFLIEPGGPVLGAHVGPDTVAAFMLADHR